MTTSIAKRNFPNAKQVETIKRKPAENQNNWNHLMEPLQEKYRHRSSSSSHLCNTLQFTDPPSP